jgi:PAS domain S-box-containing protein
MNNKIVPLILIIDDNFELRMLRQALLQKNGYQVITAENGKEGLEMANRHVPDLVLLDVVMPEMGGLDVLQALKQEQKTESIFVIMISGQQKSSEDLTKALAMGADGYLTSPIPNELLVAQLRTFLKHKYNMDKLRISEYDIYTKNEELEAARESLEQRNLEYQALNKELTRALKSLTASESKYKLLTENSGDVVWTMYLNGKYNYVSPSVIKAKGYTPEEMRRFKVGDSLEEVSAKKLAKVLENIQYDENNGIRKREFPRVELRQIRKDGTMYWSEVILSPIRDNKGKLIEIMGVTRNIDLKKRIESSLNQNLERYGLAQKIGKVGNWEYNIETTEFWGSDEAKRMYGFDPETAYFTVDEVEGCIPERERVHKALDDLIKKEKPYDLEFEIIPKNGEPKVRIQSKAQLVKNADGQPIMVAGVIQDITDRKKTELALKESEERFRFLSEVTFEAIVIHQKGIIIDVNSAFEKITGYTRNEVIGQNLFSALVSQKDLEKVQQNVVKEHATPYQIRAAKKDGSLFWAEIEGRNVIRRDEKIRIVAIRDISEKVKARQDLMESEEKYRRVVNNSLEGIFIIQNAKFVYVNPTLEKMLGYDFREIKAYDIQDFIHPDDRQKVMDNNKKRMEGLDIKPYDFRVLNRNKESIWVHLNATKISWNDEDAVLCFLTDIHDRKLAEQTLKEREQSLKNIVENSTNVFYTHDTNHVLKYLSPQIESLLGYTPEEAYVKWTELVSDHPINEEGFQKTMKTITTGELQEPYQLELVHKSGKKVWVETREVPIIENGKVIAIAGSLNDITDRKAAEDALKESERRFRAYVQASPTAVFLADENGKYTFVNPAACRLLGYSKEELLNMSIPDILPDKQLKNGLQNFELVKIKGKSESSELMFRHKNGDKIDVLIEAVRLSENEFMAYCRDISKLKNAERELQKANEEYMVLNEELEKGNRILHKTNKELEQAKKKAEESDRLKSAFLANMSHEIRTPMNGILGFAELLKEPELKGDEAQHYVEIIQKSGHRMLNIINDLINISKIEAGQMEVQKVVTNITDQINTLYNFFLPETKKKGLALELKVEANESVSEILTDKEKLLAILTNLLKNAIKYTHKGTIKFGYSFGPSSGSKQIKFFVSDTGIGIPGEKQEAVFERFIQADNTVAKPYEGAGLGLSISKAYVEMLGGKIWVESEVGKGSVFYFTIPAEIAVRENPVVSGENIHGPELSEKLSGLNLKILIVEDSEFSDYYLKKVLQPFASQILHAANGKEAVETARQNHNIDLILMDIKMPEMDGYQATREIRKFNRDVIIIAQTAFAMIRDQEKAIEAGCNGYITKPVLKKVLIAEILKFFGD